MKLRNTTAVSGLDTAIVLSDVVSLVVVLNVELVVVEVVVFAADSVIVTVSVVVVTVSVTSVYSVTTTGGCSGSIIVIDRKNVSIYPFFLF